MRDATTLATGPVPLPDVLHRRMRSTGSKAAVDQARSLPLGAEAADSSDNARMPETFIQMVGGGSLLEAPIGN